MSVLRKIGKYLKDMWDMMTEDPVEVTMLKIHQSLEPYKVSVSYNTFRQLYGLHPILPDWSVDYGRD